MIPAPNDNPQDPTTSRACNSSTVADEAPLPGPVFKPGTLLAGRYRIQRSLGSGGQGQVFAAFDEAAARGVAIKVPRPGRGPVRIRREARALRKAAHPHIVAALAFDSAHDPPLLVMEQLGPTLSDVLREAPTATIPTSVLATYAQHVLTAIHALHRAGLVHRDIKPSNLAVSLTPPHVKLLDLGLAKPWPSRDAKPPGGFVGTARYASLRTHDGHAHAPIDDLWSLLYTLMHCHTGTLPWPRHVTRAEVHKQKAALHGPALCASLPNPFERIRSALAASTTDAEPATTYTAISEALHDLHTSAGPVPNSPTLRARMDAATAWRTTP